jgi:hypothetical protein
MTAVTLQLARACVASLALLLAVGPAVAQSDGNVMEPRVSNSPKKSVPQRGSIAKSAAGKEAGPDKDRSSPAPADPSKKAAGSRDKAAAMSPIAFYVAKGEPNTCGHGCSEWIAAEGRMDPGSGARFRAFLDKLGKRKLPIYFNSPGGSVGDSIEIGRLMRERAMTAGVGWTIPQGCGPVLPPSPACNALKRSGREVVADLNTSIAQCNSACVYALLGGAVRTVAAGAQLGIHSSKIHLKVTTSRPLSEAERVRAQGMLGQVARERLQSGYDRLERYIFEMGISPGLLFSAREVRHEDVRFLKRSEIVLWGIDRRQVVEDNWVVDERPAAAPAVLKLIYDTSSNMWGPVYRLTFVRLACSGGDHVQLDYGQEVTSSMVSLPRSIRMSAGGNNFTLPSTAYRAKAGEGKPQMEIRRARVPVSFFEAAAGGEAIGLVETDQKHAAAAPRISTLSTAGLAKSLGVLAERCAAVPVEPAAQSASVPGATQ